MRMSYFSQFTATRPLFCRTFSPSAPTVFWESGGQPAVSTPMEVFSAGGGCTASRVSRSTRRGSHAIVGDDLVVRVGPDAYANLVLGPMLSSSGLSDIDRRFVTELVYGTTRMRRACDSIVDRFVTSPPDDATRSILRLGAYQLVFARVAPHAAVGETVGLAPKRTRGFVNAVLRKVSRLSLADMSWPSDGARLSYPDWIELLRFFSRWLDASFVHDRRLAHIGDRREERLDHHLAERQQRLDVLPDPSGGRQPA